MKCKEEGCNTNIPEYAGYCAKHYKFIMPTSSDPNDYKLTFIMNKEDKREISAYLYMFGAWLTSRKERSGPFSSKDNAAPMADLLDEFIKKYDLGEPDFDLIPDGKDLN